MAETPSKSTPAKASPAKAAPAPAPASEPTASTVNAESVDPKVGHTTKDGVVSSAGIPGEDVERATEVVKAATEADPAAHVDGQGQSYYNPASVGSGTILPDGTYGDPLPDPNLQRKASEDA